MSVGVRVDKREEEKGLDIYGSPDISRGKAF